VAYTKKIVESNMTAKRNAMSLREAVEKKKFVVTAEVGPAKGIDIHEFNENADLLKGKVDAVNCTDQQSAVMRLGSLAACLLLKQKGIDPVFQMEILLEELTSMKIELVGKGPILSLEVGRAPQRALLVGNKCDVKNAMAAYQKFETHFKGNFPILPISAQEGMNLDELRREIYQILDILRVYTKPPEKNQI
jgi:hypothetical protein